MRPWFFCLSLLILSFQNRIGCSQQQQPNDDSIDIIDEDGLDSSCPSTPLEENSQQGEQIEQPSEPVQPEQQPKVDEEEYEEDDPDATLRKLRTRLSECSDVPCMMRYWKGDVFLQDHWERKPLQFDASALLNSMKPPGARLGWNDLVELAERNYLTWSATNLLYVGNTPSTPSRYVGQTMTRKTMEQATQRVKKKTTLVMSHLQTIHSGIADFCLQWQRGLGLATNVNVRAFYVGGSEGGGESSSSSSSPLLTSRAEILYLPTSGRQRVKVYAPKIMFPVWGVHGAAEWGKDPRIGKPNGIPEWILGRPVIDAILRPGQVMYVPRGFPYSTTPIKDDDTGGGGGYSVGMTLELYTEAHHYVYEKIVRCALSKAGLCDEIDEDDDDQASCGALGQTLIQYARSTKGKDLRRAIPLGFLNAGGPTDWFSFIKPVADTCTKAVSYIFRKAAADQKTSSADSDSSSTEAAKTKVDKMLTEVAGRMFQIQKADMEELDKVMAGNPFYNDQYPPNQRQALWRKIFGMIGPFQHNYCNPEGIKRVFQDYFHPDLEPDDFTKALIEAVQK